MATRGEVNMPGYEATRHENMQGHCSEVGCHNIGYYDLKEMDTSHTEWVCALHLPSGDARVDFVNISIDDVIGEALQLMVKAGLAVKHDDGTYTLIEDE